MTNHDLWLVPRGEAYEKLKAAITDMAGRHGGPVFEPHITLLTNLGGSAEEVQRRSEKLASKIAPFSVELTRAEAGTTYFQCVYLTVKPTPELLAIRAAAAAAFDQSPGAYMPHVSLLYGDHSAEERAAICAEVPASLCMTFPIDAIQLIASASDDPKDWRCVAQLALESDKPIPS